MPTDLSALRNRPAAIEPAFGQIALPDADVEATLECPRPDLGVTLDLQHELPAVGAREVRHALPSRECGAGFPLLLEIRPFIRGGIPTPHEVKPGFLHRVVVVIVVGVLDAIHLDRILPRVANPTDLVERTVRGERVRAFLSEILPKPLVTLKALS